METQVAGLKSEQSCPPQRRWHNHLPGWILDDPGYKGDEVIKPLDGIGRLLLQTIADACDRPTRMGGDLDGAFCGLGELAERIGCSRRTVRRKIETLLDLGFLVRKLRGGDVRMATRAGTLMLTSSYRIPGIKLFVDVVPQPVAKLATGGGQVVPQGGQIVHLPSYKPSVISSFDNNTMRDDVVGQRRRAKKQWHLQKEYLENWRTVGALYGEAKRLGLIGAAEVDALYFFTAAVHSLRIGARNPCGLFNLMVRQRAQRWMFITQADERRGAEWHKAWNEMRGYGL